MPALGSRWNDHETTATGHAASSDSTGPFTARPPAAQITREIRSRAGGRKTDVLSAGCYVFQHDLVSDYSLGEMHLIFCRNVLIYFGEGLRRRVFALFAEGLSRGGFLRLGASEGVPARERASYQEVSPAVRIYRRRVVNESNACAIA